MLIIFYFMILVLDMEIRLLLLVAVDLILWLYFQVRQGHERDRPGGRDPDLLLSEQRYGTGRRRRRRRAAVRRAPVPDEKRVRRGVSPARHAPRIHPQGAESGF